MRVRYSGPVRGAHMLSKELEDAGLRVDFAAPMERRGVGMGFVIPQPAASSAEDTLANARRPSALA